MYFKKNYKSQDRIIPEIAMIVLVIVMSSCVGQSKVEYLQDRDKNIKSFEEAEYPDYRLKPNDELYIQINSLDEGAANVFSNTSNQQYNSNAMSPYGASLMSYSIDKDGYLLLPVIGSLLIKDKTIKEVTTIIRDSLSHILNQPVVSIKLVNRYISVLGEVKSPGHYPYSQDKLTIFDAIGLAGDITDYGNRSKVILIRNENGDNIRANLNLSRSEILASGFYYLRPNDIVYVKPLKNKFWGMREFPFSIVFSAITTGLLLYNVLK